MEYNNNLSEISAEMLLGYFYPELVGQWKAHHMGTFYRNYNRDVLDLYEEEHTVVLSRDGFLQLLPKGLLTTEDKAKSDKSRTTSDQQRRISMLQDAFLPFDTYWFNKKLQVELQISDMLRSKLEYLLKEYFDFDLSAQTNFYTFYIIIIQFNCKYLSPSWVCTQSTSSSGMPSCASVSS